MNMIRTAHVEGKNRKTPCYYNSNNNKRNTDFSIKRKPFGKKVEYKQQYPDIQTILIIFVHYICYSQ